jgi:SAM-dependent methyltransferase
MTNEEKTKQWIVELGKGIEIGAWLNPLPNIEPIYVDLFEEFAGQKCNVDILSEPTDLPFENGQLDYVASSHVIEHIANPIRALVEWTRITRHNGILYLVIPDRKFTWERNRPVVRPIIC